MFVVLFVFLLYFVDREENRRAAPRREGECKCLCCVMIRSPFSLSLLVACVSYIARSLYPAPFLLIVFFAKYKQHKNGNNCDCDSTLTTTTKNAEKFCHIGRGHRWERERGGGDGEQQATKRKVVVFVMVSLALSLLTV